MSLSILAVLRIAKDMQRGMSCNQQYSDFKPYADFLDLENDSNDECERCEKMNQSIERNSNA